MREIARACVVILLVTLSAMMLLPLATVHAASIAYLNEFAAGTLGVTGSTNTFDRTYGGTSYDSAQSVQQTKDGGYVVAGYTTSFGAGGRDFWVLKLDSGGSVTTACSASSSGTKYSGTSAVSTATPAVTTISAAPSTGTVTPTSVTGTAATGVQLKIQC